MDDFFWSLECHAVGFAEFGEVPATMTKKKFKEPIYSIIDTSSPTISIAADYFEKYIEAIFDATAGGSNYQVEQGQVLTSCDY